MAPQARGHAAGVLGLPGEQGIDALAHRLHQHTGDLRGQRRPHAPADLGAERHVSGIEVEAEPPGPALDLRRLQLRPRQHLLQERSAQRLLVSSRASATATSVSAAIASQ